MATKLQEVKECVDQPKDGTHYQDLLKKLDEHLEQKERCRYQPMETRKKEGVYSLDTIKNLSHGKYLTSWRGVNLMKGPQDIVIGQELIWQEKPATIIEIGAYTGASAMWMADIAKLGGFACHVYSMDIDISLVDPRARDTANVTFIQGDATKIGESFPAELLKDLPHPWLILEDAHVDVIGCMEYFHQYMNEGDYFIIEDTNPSTAEVSGQGLHEELGYDAWGYQKHLQLEKFMTDHKEYYAVDSHYTDFFGYNGTWNWNGYIRKIK